MFALGKGKEWWNWLNCEDQRLIYSPLRLLMYYFKFWCLKESSKGLITTFLTPFGRAPSWFPFSSTSWKLIFLAAANFGLNQIMQVPPRWPMKVQSSIRVETQEYWRRTSWAGSSVCLSSTTSSSTRTYSLSQPVRFALFESSLSEPAESGYYSPRCQKGP